MNKKNHVVAYRSKKTNILNNIQMLIKEILQVFEPQV